MKVIGENILLKIIDQEVAPATIIVETKYQDPTERRYKVVGLGDGVILGGEYKPFSVKLKDVVIVNTTLPIEVNDEEFHLCRQADIFCVI